MLDDLEVDDASKWEDEDDYEYRRQVTSSKGLIRRLSDVAKL